MNLHPSSLGSRRAFLSESALGFGALALGAMLDRDGLRADETYEPPTGEPHFPPKAKNVIWIFLVGGLSHMESFDPKPALNEHTGKTIEETPFSDVVKSPYLKKNLRELAEGLHKVRREIYPLQVGYRKFGESGLEMSDWFSTLGNWCADDLCLIRSMWTTDNDHGAQLQFHTGRHVLEGPFPTIGSWVHYGLGSMNDDLPSFVVIGRPIADCCGGIGAHGASYLGPEHSGVQLAIDPKAPLPFAMPAQGVFREEQAGEFELLGQLNSLAAAEFPNDPALAARAKSYELAYRMQAAAPKLVDFSAETAETHSLYGLDHADPGTRDFAQQCLAARRMVEQGVRFVQLFHGSNGGAGAWDAHSNLKTGHTTLCGQIDRPIAALIKDLKQRGLLDETLVVIGTEFGRTPGAEGANGRDHHPYGFSIAMAGAGLRKGVTHGATDELGFHAVEHRHYVTDVHATVLHLLGLDSRRLVIPGRKRLDIDFGNPIREVMN